jgi:peptidyl-prolyl cis-trans isomerase SurA
MSISFRHAVQWPAAMALALGVWGAWAHTASSESNVVVMLDGDAENEIEQRARLLGLSVNVSEQAKANFQQLLRSKSGELEEKMKALQREVIAGNPGKTREELIAIFKERQKEIGSSLQKEAVKAARDEVMPKLRKDAREELIDERLKLQAAKKGGIEISDADAKSLVEALAARNSMTYEQFADHLKRQGVNIATMIEKLRAQKAWSQLKNRASRAG